MSANFDLAVARTMANQMGGERTRRLLLALCDEVERLRAEADAERAAVVAWLRRTSERMNDATLAHAADCIEDGEHRREQER